MSKIAPPTQILKEPSLTIVFNLLIKSRRMGWTGYIARIGERRGTHRVLVGKPEGKRRLGIPGYRWEDNIKIDLEEVGWGHGLD